MTPRVIGLVSWWDESPTWLSATVASLGRFCDHVVALDGRYAMYPDQRLQSSTAELMAIIEAARAVGVGLTIHTAPHTFDDEMQKRSYLFKLGALEATAHEDFFFILDGDEVVIEAPPKDELVSRLADTSADVITATLFERTDPHSDPQRTDLSMKLPLEWRYECSTPRFWRAHENLRVIGYHYNYVGEDRNGDTVEMWGHDGLVERVEWESMCGKVIIENRNRMRGKQRDADRETYYQDRDNSGLETIAPLAELKRKEAHHAA